MRKFKLDYNIGRVKYCISLSDGTKFHPDGSEFFDIEIFKNKKKFNHRIKQLIKNGYKMDL